MISFGGFLNSNFWSSYRQASNSIDELLNKEDCTVESLLNDDDCLQEFKSHNEKLLNYFEHDKIAKLIEMITEMPSQDVDHARGHKFPFLSSEIFSCENNVILDKFFEAPAPAKPKASESAEDDAAVDDNDRLQGNDDGANNDDIGNLDEDIVQHGDDNDDAAEDDNNNDEAAEDKEQANEDSAETKDKEEDASEEKQEESSADQKVEEEVKAEVEEPEEQKDEVTTANEPESESSASQEKPTVVSEPEEEDTATSTEASQKQEPEPEESQATATEEDKKDADEQPEAEKDENDAEQSKDEKAAEEQVEEEPVSKYMLLDKLFSFIETKEKPLNPVLAGYFQKLVTILLNRKQRQLLPYIFAKDSPVMDNLLYHVYQKSISEVLNKFVNLSDNNCSDELAQEIKAKQQHVMNYLSDKLSPEYTEEDNLNAATIINDLMENKEFFQIVAKQQNIRKLVDFSLDQSETSTESSRVCSVQVLTQIIRSAVANLLIQDNKKTKGDAEGEDMFIIQDSDEDEEELISKPIVEILKESLPKIEKILEGISRTESATRAASYTDEQRKPLGRYNLSVIELLFQVLKLNKQPVYDEFKQSTILKRVLDLVAEHPWNNFLQLKANQIFEEVITSHDIPIDSRIAMIEKAELFQWLTIHAKQARFTHSSGRSVRNGYMGFVIKLGNILKKQVDDLSVLFKNLADDSWTTFVDGELKKSNEINQRNLGGQQPFNSFDEEEDNNSYEQNMEKIMQRFTSFTNQMSSNNSSNNDDKDDNDNDEEDDVLRDRSNSEDAEKTIEVTLPEDTNKVDSEFADGSYWRVDTGASDELLDELLADYE